MIKRLVAARMTANSATTAADAIDNFSLSLKMEEKALIAVNLIFEEEEEEEQILALICERESPNDLFTTRESEGFQKILIHRHLLKDEIMFRKFFRLNINQFNFVLSLIEDSLQKQSCGKVKRPITPAEKLGLTLRYMATGESFQSLSFAFRISPSYISRIVKQVLKVCTERLPAIFMPPPSPTSLSLTAADFKEKWQFPNCIAAIDGKHIRIFCPGKSGSLFFNYKDYFSIVMLAVVDANCKFIMVDIGSYGKEGDSSILEKSLMGTSLNNDAFFPIPTMLPNSNLIVPYVIVGDGAFRLSKHMMKPFTRNAVQRDTKKAVFNYRLSRARRVSENAFALLCQVFRVFYQPIALNPAVTDHLIMTACCLQNMLRNAYLEEQNKIFYEVSTEPPPTHNMIPLRATGGFTNSDGFNVRNHFVKYFSSREGMVVWQTSQVTRT